MKYIILVGDGMADLPLAELGGKTPLSAAEKPAMDYIASRGLNGRVNTVPEGMVPESDTANLAIMGYDPRVYSKGRSPLEAASIGIKMQDDETAIRANVVCLSEEEALYEDKRMIDHSAGEISTEEADELIKAVQKAFGNEFRTFYTGVSYRHCLIWKNCPDFTDFSRPHDILGKRIGDHAPVNLSSRPFWELQKASYDLLNQHPVNLARAAAGKRKANSLWFWGAGTKPSLESFESKTGLKGAMISAVDLLKGIAVGAGMKVLHVPGATGGLHTNYEGKADAAIQALLEDGCDFAYVHVEAPDEMGHQGSVENKIKSIENLDRRVISRIKDALDDSGEPYRMLICPDHPTPIRCRTHTSDPVPYILYDSTCQRKSLARYSEHEALLTGIYEPQGYKLMERLLNK